jgi:hypothetical protein
MHDVMASGPRHIKLSPLEHRQPTPPASDAANAPPMCALSPPVGASRRDQLGAPFLLYCGEATPSASVTSATCRSGQ